MGRGSAYQSGGLAWAEVHEVKYNWKVSWLQNAETQVREVQYLNDALDLAREALGNGAMSILILRLDRDA